MMQTKEKGISLIALIITIVVLLILATITIGFGGNAIERAKVENLKTNMLLIEAKTRKQLENASYDLGVKPEEASPEMKAKSLGELKGTQIATNTVLTNMGLENVDLETEKNQNVYYYELSSEDLLDLGLSKVKSDSRVGVYIVKYDITNIVVEIYHTTGVKLEEKTYHSLSELKNIEI